MLLSQMFAVALSISANSAALDPVDTTRNAFTGCLRHYVDAQIQDHKRAAEIRTGLAQQCMEQEQAYRAAMIQSDRAARISQAEAERNAAQEITDARSNASESFSDGDQSH